MAQKNIIKRIISNPLVQTILIYVSGGWIALEMTDYFINKYGLNDRISDVLSIILLIGLPIALFLSWYLSRENTEGEETSQGEHIQGSLTIQKDQRARIIYRSRRPHRWPEATTTSRRCTPPVAAAPRPANPSRFRTRNPSSGPCWP